MPAFCLCKSTQKAATCYDEHRDRNMCQLFASAKQRKKLAHVTESTEGVTCASLLPLLCYAMLCHAMPCHAMPCLAMPCYATLCYAISGIFRHLQASSGILRHPQASSSNARQSIAKQGNAIQCCQTKKSSRGNRKNNLIGVAPGSY